MMTKRKATKADVRNIKRSRTADSEVIFCYVPIEIKAAFKAKAYESGKDMSRVVRELVNDYLKEE